MKEFVPSWTTLSENPPVLVKEYSFGNEAFANAIAVALPNKQWMMVSPPMQMSQMEVDAFLSYGSVVALVENNGVHHLGLGPNRERFKEALTYATPRAAARIRKKGKNFGELYPIERLNSFVGDHIFVVSVSGDKIGDIVVFIQTEQGIIFYAGDIFINLKQLPSKFLIRLLFKWTKSAPGLRVFHMYFKFFMNDGNIARRDLIKELEFQKPTVLIPAHGEIVKDQNLGAMLIDLLKQTG